MSTTSKFSDEVLKQIAHTIHNHFDLIKERTVIQEHPTLKKYTDMLFEIGIDSDQKPLYKIFRRIIKEDEHPDEAIEEIILEFSKPLRDAARTKDNNKLRDLLNKIFMFDNLHISDTVPAQILPGSEHNTAGDGDNPLRRIDFHLDGGGQLVKVELNSGEKVFKDSKLTKTIRDLYRMHDERGLSLRAEGAGVAKKFHSNRNSAIVKTGYTNLKKIFKHEGAGTNRKLCLDRSQCLIDVKR